MKILFVGDVVGKIGRQAVAEILPKLREQYQIDLVILNAENSAHGAGITSRTINALRQSGADFFTSGNHVLSKPEAAELLTLAESVLIRPANYPTDTPGAGYKLVEVGSRSVLIVNLLGQVFMKEEVANPFKTLDEILAKVDAKNLAGIIVDFHAEATSEKNAFGWYAAGRVSAVLGSHTHVATADARILDGMTAYVSDAGMVGARDSVIGDSREPIINSFLTGAPIKIDIPESGPAIFNSVLVEIDPVTRQAKSIERLDRTVEV
ncbi:MAG: TIGR00282 family metallophosphoesterase [Patescibacteria group bacterium]|jgi:metallophosphoesterase (TIGR00282 family)|nr:TIGR00282 family metallophosphoesterase [Patescibacteria group bacterium]